MASNLTAATRLEKLLANIAGGDNDVTPATRIEKLLADIAEAVGSGGGSGGGFVFPLITDASYIEGPVYTIQNGDWATRNGDLEVYPDYVRPEQLLYITDNYGDRLFIQTIFNDEFVSDSSVTKTESGTYYTGETKTVTCVIIEIENTTFEVVFGVSGNDFEWFNV